MAFERIGIRPADILLPAAGVAAETWACVACDQYTSEPEYWRRAEALVGEAPSALRLILPECDLADSEQRIPRIHAEMEKNLREGLLTVAVKHGFVLCERTTPAGTRLGLVCAVDLEDYSFDRGAKPLIRPTEETIASRLPPRLRIRRGAPVELTHIMILVDDPEGTVLEPLRAEEASLRKLYDFDLMLGGGHLRGYAVEDAARLARIDAAMNALRDRQQAATGEETPMLLAVGDGNHSLATAKAAWEEIRPTLPEEARANHPARFALCEIVNLHDAALQFEPIHRLLKGTERAALLADWRQYAEARGMALETGDDGVSAGTGRADPVHRFRMIGPDGEETVSVLRPEGAIPCATVQLWLDDYLRRHPEAEIDYIHGETSLRTLAGQADRVGFLLPPVDKETFFRDVTVLGVLPRKTFSMGEADEKRFYMEARRI